MADKPKLTAKDGYFMAKREMQDAIMRRVEKLERLRDDAKNNYPVTGNHREYDACIRSLEEIRSFVRNVMLWDTGND